ncbi:MAG: MoaD/ThiS family protein [Pseudomonadales bacterium]|nr:MoaD/ThiS family protein [Pseudomonadales bacterium]
MLRVNIGGSLRTAVEGADAIDLEAETIDELLRSLSLRYPRFEPLLKSGIAVAINGEIYRDNWYVKIPLDAEVFILPRIQGG